MQQAKSKKACRLHKAATTGWLSNEGDATCLVICLQAVLDVLNTIIAFKNKLEKDGIRLKFLKPNNVLFLLLPEHVLVSANCLS